MQNTIPLTPISRSTLHDEVVSRLRQLIVDGALLPGERISERDLCARFGVSRTPLREALKVLATEGLIEILPGRGARVATFSESALREAFEVIGALEGLAATLACARLTDAGIEAIAALTRTMHEAYARRDRETYFELNERIHVHIVAGAGNPTLENLYRTLGIRVRRARYLANLSAERWAEAMREHDEILAALRARDGERAGGLLRDHLARKVDSVVEQFIGA